MLLLLLLLILSVFVPKLLIMFCNIFHSDIQFRPQIFFRTDIGSSYKKSFEYAGNCVRGHTRMWLNLYVRYFLFLCEESLNIFLHFHVLLQSELFVLFI